MILVVGGAGSGKRAYAAERCGVDVAAAADARADGAAAAEAASAGVLCNAQELVRETASSPAAVAALLGRLSAVTCEEVGCGVVPLDPEERAWRERAGRLACLLAEQADEVVRMVAGIPCVVKRADGAPAEAEPLEGAGAASGESPLDVVLVRHGATPGNRARRYVGGGTDEPLDADGARAVADAAPGLRRLVDALADGDAARVRVYTSGMARADETARILFPSVPTHPVFDLREMEFGAFEGRSADELADDPAYRAWVDGWCETACPGGESRASFTARCVRVFLQAARHARAQGARVAVFVVHGGTVKALLGTLSDEPRDYFSVETPCGGWWRARFDDGLLTSCEQGGAR